MDCYRRHGAAWTVHRVEEAAGSGAEGRWLELTVTTGDTGA
jgi:hypothetical protein